LEPVDEVIKGVMAKKKTRGGRFEPGFAPSSLSARGSGER